MFIEMSHVIRINNPVFPLKRGKKKNLRNEIIDCSINRNSNNREILLNIVRCLIMCMNKKN